MAKNVPMNPSISPSTDSRQHLCVDCGADISHRARNARFCESCWTVREKERKSKAYQDNRTARREAASNAYWQDRTPVLQCVDCGADISHRPRNTRLCESCSAIRDKQRKRQDYREKRAERLQRSKDYYRENHATVLQRVKSYQQTPGYRKTHQAWREKNADKIRERKRQSHREKTGYNPEARPPCEKCGGAIEVDRGHRARWCRICSAPRTCIVCGKETGKRGPSLFCSDQCRQHDPRPKRCTKCRERKQRGEFGRHNGRTRSACKICEVKIQSVLYYNFTPEQRASRNSLRRGREEAKRAAMSPEERHWKTTRLRQALRRKLYGPDFDENRWYSDQKGQVRHLPHS